MRVGWRERPDQATTYLSTNGRISRRGTSTFHPSEEVGHAPLPARDVGDHLFCELGPGAKAALLRRLVVTPDCFAVGAALPRRPQCDLACLATLSGPSTSSMPAPVIIPGTPAALGQTPR